MNAPRPARSGVPDHLHDKTLLGEPDIILPRWHSVIEIRGCFWLGHENCGQLPKRWQEFWRPKITSNRERDVRNEATLLDQAAADALEKVPGMTEYRVALGDHAHLRGRRVGE